MRFLNKKRSKNKRINNLITNAMEYTKKMLDQDLETKKGVRKYLKYSKIVSKKYKKATKLMD